MFAWSPSIRYNENGNSKYKYVGYAEDYDSAYKLLLEFNYHYFKDKLDEDIYNTVLEKDKKYQYDWKHNLSNGSVAKNIEDKKLKERVVNLAKKVSKQINLKFGSVDIIETDNNELLVLELNSGVMTENYLTQNPDKYEFIKDIYSDAVDEMFNN